ncbi:unnamed protein product [Phytomonas sp. Hart1]|nr:unnamed protein product [Phytomonas sp. Hart1]|eukprot:CCW66904.1 unnamed protein product [Phytomonas sp. isolate Hart1]
MSLLRSTGDGAFVAEVRAAMEDHGRLGAAQTSAMIEAYLQSREAQMEAQLRQEIAGEAEKAQREREGHDRAREKVLAKLSMVQQTLAQTANGMGNLRKVGILHCFFHRWLEIRRDRQVRLEQLAQFRLYSSQLAASRCFQRWRFLALRRRVQQQQARQKKKWTTHEKALTQKMEDLTRELEAEKHRNAELDGKLRESFLRGVSALNREAFQVLRGEKSDHDIAVIEEILGKELGKSSTTIEGPPPATVSPVEGPRRAERGPASGPSLASSGVCPVHRVDNERNFYHRCYAPSTCEYGPPKAANDSAPRMPFHVRIDNTQVPSYNAGPRIRTLPAKTSGRR